MSNEQRLRDLLRRVLVEDWQNVDAATNLSYELTDDIAKALGCTCGSKLAHLADCPVHELGGGIKR